MNVREFIETVLINDVKAIQQEHNFHYISFGLIAQGIEFLGTCLDNHPFIITGKGAERFNNSIKTLFPVAYHQYVKQKSNEQFDLYGNLRCGLLHVFVPGSDLEVIQKSEILYYGEHLTIKNLRGRDRLILVSQTLMQDFENACREIIHRIDSNDLTSPKVYGEMLSTSHED